MRKISARKKRRCPVGDRSNSIFPVSVQRLKVLVDMPNYEAASPILTVTSEIFSLSVDDRDYSLIVTHLGRNVKGCLRNIFQLLAPQQIRYIEALGKSLLRSTASKQTAVAFLGPRFAPPVVAVAFPKTEFFGFCKLQPVNPFSAFPSVQVGNYQPHGAAVVWG